MIRTINLIKLPI